MVVLLLCVGISAATAGRLPLWTLLLGTAALVGAYEYTYAAAPPELMTTALETATDAVPQPRGRLLRRVLADPRRRPPRRLGAAAEARDNPTTDGHSDRLRLNDMMETTK